MSRDLTSGPILKSVLDMTFPMTWGLLSVIAFNLADTYFIGQLGKTELAAISLTFPVVMVFFSLALGTATAVSSVVARSIGEKNEQKVKRYTSDALTLGIIVVVLSVLVGFSTIDIVFELLGATSETLPIVRDYMEIWYAGIAFLTIPMAGNGAIRAKGEMKVASTIMFVAAITNIILDPILIFGWGFIPAFGVKGAALATVIARATTLIASLYFLHFKFKMLDFTRPKLSEALASWKKILHIAIPSAGTNLLAPIATAFATAIVARLGQEELAAYGVVNRVESFALIFIYALSSAVAPLVGQNYGAKKWSRVQEILSTCYRLSWFWMLVTVLILFPLGKDIITLFNSDSMIITVGSRYLYLVPLSFGALGVRLIVSSYFNAIGKPGLSVVLGVLNLIVIFIPLIYLGARYFEMDGIIYAHLITNLLIGVIAYFIVKLHLRKEIKC